MDYTAQGQVFSDQAIKPGPRQSMSLASTQQGVSPGATHFAEKPRQSALVTRHRVVIKIAINHTPQPSTYHRHRFVPSAHQRCANGCQRCTHPFLDRQPDDCETAAIPSTAVCETEKVECFRLSHATLPALLRRESSKSDQPRFIRVKFQFEFGKTLSHGCQKPSCFAFVLEPHHAVVCITHKDDIASSTSLPSLMRPEIKGVVQIDIGQQW